MDRIHRDLMSAVLGRLNGMKKGVDSHAGVTSTCAPHVISYSMTRFLALSSGSPLLNLLGLEALMRIGVRELRSLTEFSARFQDHLIALKSN